MYAPTIGPLPRLEIDPKRQALSLANDSHRLAKEISMTACLHFREISFYPLARVFRGPGFRLSLMLASQGPLENGAFDKTRS
jgi:hypothetical protein